MAGDSLSVTQTGLQAINTALQAVSDNLANADTTGFKAESVEFETLLGEFVAGNPLGGGVTANAIVRDFSEGSIVQSNSPTDMAIQGNGFFVFQDPSGSPVFSRDGQMSLGANGTLLAFNGDQVMGYSVDSSGSTGGVLGPIAIPQGVLAPTASTKTGLAGNLNSASPVIGGAIDPTDPTTYNASVSVQVYDSLGNSHVLTYFFQNSGPPAVAGPDAQVWNWTATLDGSTTGLANNSGSVGFDTNGIISSGAIPASALTAAPAGAAAISLNLDFSSLTQFSGATAATGTADGNAVGRPLGVQVDSKGIISVSYSNGQQINVGQVAVATFPALQGLQLTNGGVFSQTSASGTPTIATAGAGSAGVIRPSSLENSNVDTTGQLISLVVLQRQFQANAKALQTADNILGTVVQLQTN
jgi:flagellar hook protein FlgE